MASSSNVLNMEWFYQIRERKAHNLRRLRDKHNLTQQDIADVLGGKYTNISEMELGKRGITDKTIGLLCEHYGWHYEDFIVEPNTQFIANEQEQKFMTALRIAELNNIDLSDVLTLINIKIQKSWKELTIDNDEGEKKHIQKGAR